MGPQGQRSKPGMLLGFLVSQLMIVCGFGALRFPVEQADTARVEFSLKKSPCQEL